MSLTGAVLADDDGDGAIEIEVKIAFGEQRQAERVGLGRCDARRVEPNAAQIGRRQIDLTALAPAAHEGSFMAQLTAGLVLREGRVFCWSSVYPTYRENLHPDARP
jgi:hypothetical protein